MFIYNFKINGKKLFKVCFSCMTLLLIFLLVFVTFRVFYGARNSISSCEPQNDVFSISPQNYTNVLKAVHDNLDNYIGKKINFKGFVYRIYDLNDNQFVLARNMIISSDFNYVVVGFLCESDEASKFEDNTWVDVTGEIYKGDYHGEIPIIKITNITQCDKPGDEFVYPPDESYIPTSSWL